MIKVVLFDFYGVFLPDSYGVWLNKNGLKREGIFAELINERDRGMITETHFLGELSRLLEREVVESEIHIKNIHHDGRLVDLIQELRPRYKIGLFSNASEKLRAKLDELNLSNLFDEILISSEIGFAKPSQEAFQIAIQKSGVEPSEISFIDDNFMNTAAANECGMHAIEFTTVDDLRQQFKSDRIL